MKEEEIKNLKYRDASEYKSLKNINRALIKKIEKMESEQIDINKAYNQGVYEMKQNFKPLPPTKEEYKHIWDSEELNPHCHYCGLLMRDDKQDTSDWEEQVKRIVLSAYNGGVWSNFNSEEKSDDIIFLIRSLLEKNRQEAYDRGIEHTRNEIVSMIQNQQSAKSAKIN